VVAVLGHRLGRARGASLLIPLYVVGLGGSALALGALAGGLGSVLGGWLAGLGYPLAFGVAGGLVAVAAGLVVSIQRRSQQPVSEEDATVT